MRRTFWIPSGIIGWLFLAGVCIALAPGPGYAQTGEDICPADPGIQSDYDADGYSDFLECEGFSLGDGTPVDGFNNRYDQSGSLRPREEYLDPSSRDLFVILERPAGSLYPGSDADWMGYIIYPVAPPGLNTALHFISWSNVVTPSDRQVTTESPQKALRIIEDALDPNGEPGAFLGYTAVVAPPNAAYNHSIVYTLRTQVFVDIVCAGSLKCIDYSTGYGHDPDNSNTSIQDLYLLYHLENIAHEGGHQFGLVPAPLDTSRKSGNPTVINAHYPSSSTGSIMEDSVYYKYVSKSKTTTWYMPGHFVTYDLNNLRLK